MDNELLKSYIDLRLNGNYVDQVRRTLVAEGPQIVIPTLRMTLSALKYWGGELALLFMKPSAWPFKPDTSDGGYQVRKNRQWFELEAGDAIDVINDRIHVLMAEIASSSFQHGKMVGEQMLIALTDKDENVRAWVTIHSIADGIPSYIVSDRLVRLLFHDDDPLTRIGAALAMFRLDDMPERILSESAKHVMGFLEGDYGAFKAFPELVNKIRQRRYNLSESDQNWIIATLAVYRMLAVRLFDKGTDRSLSASWDSAQFPKTSRGPI